MNDGKTCSSYMTKLPTFVFVVLLIAAGCVLLGNAFAADPATNVPPAGTNSLPAKTPLSASQELTGARVFGMVLSIGYLLYMIQIVWAWSEAKTTMMDDPNTPGGQIPLTKLVFGRRYVFLETWAFIFFSFILATGLPAIFHVQAMQPNVKIVSLLYDVATSILFALVLLEFNYLFELKSKRNRHETWQWLILIALGIDIAMWIFLMLTGDPINNKTLAEGSLTTTFLFLTTLIAFLSSALIIIFARKLP